MAKLKLGSGADTFSDNLVGRQITDGSSLMTDTNFTVQKTIPIKESKKFKTEKFSDFVTLDDLEEKGIVYNGSGVSEEADNKIKFVNDKSNGSISLFGSLKSRVSAAITSIIANYPSGFYVDINKINREKNFTAYNVSYSTVKNITEFTISYSLISNPLSLELIQTHPNGKGFWSDYKDYVIFLNNKNYNITDYKYNISTKEITLKVKGKLFVTDVDISFLVRPNTQIVEQFFKSLDDMESILLNRTTSPLYSSVFKTPTENLDGSMVMTNKKVTWPIEDDGYHISIDGINFRTYIDDLLSICDSIDNYKSNLFVRFMSSPQLYEFDTEDRKIESVFQIYGQNFDNIKQYINNIAFMRNVSYDKISNIPDQFLKSVTKTLGLDIVNFNEQDNENETEIYRRLLINLPYLFKSKGTRKPIEFLLKFIGAPDPLIRFNEEVYEVTEIPLIDDLDDKIYDLIAGTYEEDVVSYDEVANQYVVTKVKNKINYDRNGYPVQKNSFKPKYSFSKKDDIFFQKGAGWYKPTIDHKSSEVLDTENSVLDTPIKTIITKAKDFTFGEDYFDTFRTFPGLEKGYTLNSKIDNIKSELLPNSLILNRKNITIFLSPSHLFDHIYSQSLNIIDSILVKNGTDKNGTDKNYKTGLKGYFKTHNRFDKYYYDMDNTYKQYLTNPNDPYTLHDLLNYTNSIGENWIGLVEQFIPATTLWSGGTLISNGLYGRSKYQYRKNNQTYEICNFDNANFVVDSYCLFDGGYITYDSLPCIFNDSQVEFVDYNYNEENSLNNTSLVCESIELDNVLILENSIKYEWSFGNDYYDLIKFEISYDNGVYVVIGDLSGSPVTSTYHTINNIDLGAYQTVKCRLSTHSFECGKIISNEKIIK